MTTTALTDKAVLEKIAEIVSWDEPYRVRYEALDQLWFVVENHHPDGMRAAVLETVSDAQRKMLYPKEVIPSL